MTKGQLQALWRAQHHASRALRSASARAADDGMFPMRESALSIAKARERKARAQYDAARAAWEAAGRPDQRGRVTAPTKNGVGKGA